DPIFYDLRSPTVVTANTWLSAGHCFQEYNAEPLFATRHGKNVTVIEGPLKSSFRNRPKELNGTVQAELRSQGLEAWKIVSAADHSQRAIGACPPHAMNGLDQH